jgi:hypothetical protein
MPHEGRRDRPRRRLTSRSAAIALSAALFLLALLQVLAPEVSSRLFSPVFTIGRPEGLRIFPTARDAALDFGRRYNARSISDRKEYAAVLFRVARIECRTTWNGFTPIVRPVATTFGFAYTLPVAGTHDSSIPDLFGARGPVVGILHTHGAYSPEQGAGNDDFSFGLFHDTWWADLFDLPFYLATPDGRLRVYLPDMIGPSVATLADDLPHDPWHPSRIKYGGDLA